MNHLSAQNLQNYVAVNTTQNEVLDLDNFKHCCIKWWTTGKTSTTNITNSKRNYCW